jgi:hypothetical protein
MKLKRKLYSNGIISGRELKFNTYDPLGDRRIIKFINKEEENPELEEEDEDIDDEDSENEEDKETLKEEEDYESES